ncbi:MAG: hypothetical protein ABFD50_05470 [Smithella sp.]
MDEKWSSDPHAARFAFEINGSINDQLTYQLQSMSTLETGDLLKCEVTFNNWGQVDSGVGYLYSESTIFDFNKQLQIKIGNSTVFSGPITGITFVHTHDNAPSITITAKTPIQTTGFKQRNSKSWIISCLSLRDITVEYTPGKFSGQASAEVNGFLHVGDSITINEPGSRFFGKYSVTEVKHLFDIQMGLRTEFRIERDELHRGIKS